MNHSQNVYDVRGESIPEEKALFYSFVSRGKKDVTKIVVYNYVRQFNDRPLFNIGLVDIDIETGKISDDAISDNEDQYRVFNTVLSTIPRLFDVYKDGVLIVQGSDSVPEFIENCKKNCTRQCDTNTCRKAHRRISIYRNFVNKYYEVFNQQFSFYGTDGIEEDSPIEPYKKGRDYKRIIIEKRLN